MPSSSLTQQHPLYLPLRISLSCVRRAIASVIVRVRVSAFVVSACVCVCDSVHTRARHSLRGGDGLAVHRGRRRRLVAHQPVAGQQRRRPELVLFPPGQVEEAPGGGRAVLLGVGDGRAHVDGGLGGLWVGRARVLVLLMLGVRVV